MRLSQVSTGSGGSVAIGQEINMTIGFVQEWLKWHDERAVTTEDIAMRMLPLGMALIMLVTHATAQTRPSTLAMSCQSARGIVAARGAVVLGTGGMTYSRFVSHVGACDRGQRIEPAWVPTGDGPQCFIGYRCRDTDLDNGR